MQNQNRQPGPAEPVLKRALSHPKRLEILGSLMQKKLGTDEEELVEALGLVASTVRYHLTVLHDADLIVQLDDGEARSYVVAASAST